MPKGYWIAHVEPDDEASLQSDSYKAYIEGASQAFSEHGAKFLARGGAFENAESPGLGSRHVVIEFPSLEHAKACYHSEVYQEACKHRQAVSNGHIILVEGIED